MEDTLLGVWSVGVSARAVDTLLGVWSVGVSARAVDSLLGTWSVWVSTKAVDTLLGACSLWVSATAVVLWGTPCWASGVCGSVQKQWYSGGHPAGYLECVG